MIFPPPFILLVDDDEDFASSQKALLEEDGFNVSVAHSGAEALNYGVLLMLEGAVAVVDMVMPMMDGAAAIEVMQWHYPKLRYIASSGHPEATFRERLDQLGVPCFLQKPYTRDELVRCLRDAACMEQAG